MTTESTCFGECCLSGFNRSRAVFSLRSVVDSSGLRLPSAVWQRSGAGDVRLQRLDHGAERRHSHEPLLPHALGGVALRSLQEGLSVCWGWITWLKRYRLYLVLKYCTDHHSPSIMRDRCGLIIWSSSHGFDWLLKTFSISRRSQAWRFFTHSSMFTNHVFNWTRMMFSYIEFSSGIESWMILVHCLIGKSLNLAGHWPKTSAYCTLTSIFFVVCLGLLEKKKHKNTRWDKTHESRLRLSEISSDSDDFLQMVSLCRLYCGASCGKNMFMMGTNDQFPYRVRLRTLQTSISASL